MVSLVYAFSRQFFGRAGAVGQQKAQSMFASKYSICSRARLYLATTSMVALSVLAICGAAMANASSSANELNAELVVPASFELPFSATPPKVEPSYNPSVWMPVPAWLVGTWKAQSEVILFSYNFQTQRLEVDEPIGVPIIRQSQIGMQQDAHGQVWHYLGTPYSRTAVMSSYIEAQQVQHLRTLRAGDGEVKIQSSALVTRLARDSCKLVDAFREETITTYTPLADGMIVVTFSICDFDLHARPLRRSWAACVEKRLKGFERVDQNERGQIRAEFERFCRSGRVESGH